MNYIEIIKQLDTHRKTHPHMVSLWEHYLKIKREKLFKSIEQCRVVIDKFNTIPDIDPHKLYCLYILSTIQE